MPRVVATPLTEAHRLAQARLGARTVAGMRAIWPLLDPANLDATFARWLTAALPIVRSQRIASARLAANYLAAFKMNELGLGARPMTVLDEVVDVKSLSTSLLVTGPVSIKRAQARGLTFGAGIVDAAEASSAAAAMRHVLNGGRGTILRTLKADRQARGWARVTSGKPCDFCSTLADRGAVFSEDSADFAAHDGCSCSAEPVYAT